MPGENPLGARQLAAFQGQFLASIGARFFFSYRESPLAKARTFLHIH